MLYNQKLEETMKTRLKELRKEGGWTQESVVDAINQRYPDLHERKQGERAGSDIISEGTIKQYESYGGRVSGMNIETLCLLADFYGVSVEYLLGLSKYKTPDADIKAINNKTGLSPESIKMFETFNKGGFMHIFNYFVGTGHLVKFLLELSKFTEQAYRYGKDHKTGKVSLEHQEFQLSRELLKMTDVIKNLFIPAHVIYYDKRADEVLDGEVFDQIKESYSKLNGDILARLNTKFNKPQGGTPDKGGVENGEHPGTQE